MKSTEEQFQNLFDSFGIASRQKGLVERAYQIGRLSFKLQFAGNALLPHIHSALAHLEIPVWDAVNASLRVGIFDSASTGIQIKDFPWEKHLSDNKTERWYFESPTMQAHLIQGMNALYVWDKPTGRALCWVPDANHLPCFFAATPLLPLFHWWLGKNRYQLTHASAVGNSHGAVLLVGKSGSGKSTSALACLDAGLFYLGDDMCVVEKDPLPRVRSLYSAAKLPPDSMRRFPGFIPVERRQHPLDEGKGLFFLHSRTPELLQSSLPLRAVFIPLITGRTETIIKPVKAGHALLALAPSTLFQLPGDKNRSFEFLKELIQQLPTYMIELGTNVNGIPAAINSFLGSSSYSRSQMAELKPLATQV